MTCKHARIATYTKHFYNGDPVEKGWVCECGQEFIPAPTQKEKCECVNDGITGACTPACPCNCHKKKQPEIYDPIPFCKTCKGDSRLCFCDCHQEKCKWCNPEDKFFHIACQSNCEKKLQDTLEKPCHKTVEKDDPRIRMKPPCTCNEIKLGDLLVNCDYCGGVKKPDTPKEEPRTVFLNHETFALIDEEDYPVVSRFTWRFDGRYAVTDIDGHKLYLHRLLKLPPQGMVIDHLNQDKLDNRRSNLFICDKSWNNRNKQKKAGSASRFVGVYWNKTRKNWSARMRSDGKLKNLGYFDSEEEASKAYQAAIAKLRNNL